MAEVLQFPKRPRTAKKTSRSDGFANAVADANVRFALQALNDNDEHLARVIKLSLMEVCRRLETLEAIVFAQSVLIAELRDQPLTVRQRAGISRVLARGGPNDPEGE
jgi:hypothetical protein